MKVDWREVGIEVGAPLIAGAVAWGAWSVSPMSSLAVLGSAELMFRIAKVCEWYFDGKNNSGLSLNYFLLPGIALGKRYIELFQLPSLSWPGAFFLAVGSYFARVALEIAFPKTRDATPAATS